MNDWCPKCGTYHELNTAGTCPEILEDKIFLGTYGEGHDVGYRAGVEAGKAERDKLLEEVEQLRIDVRDWKGLADRTATAIVEYGAMRERAEDECAAARADQDKLLALLREAIVGIQRAGVECEEVERRLFRASDLHDNMEHWLRMGEMQETLRTKVRKGLSVLSRRIDAALEEKPYVDPLDGTRAVDAEGNRL